MNIKKNFVTTATLGLSLCLVFSTVNFVKADKKSTLEDEYKKGLSQLYKSIGKSKKDLEDYKSFVKDKTKELKDNKINDIAATITFEDPLSYDEMQDYIKKHDIIPVRINARGLDGDERLTAMLSPDHNKEQVRVMFEEEGAKFVGYIDMYAKIDYKKIDNIEKDKRTYLLDVTGDNYFVKEITENRKAKDSYPHSLSWKLEDIKNN